MKSVVLNVCQGVGDIFWVYQKFAPYFDKIHFNVCQIPGQDDTIQNRAEPFLRLLPKTGTVGLKRVSAKEYDKLAADRFSMRKILDEYAAGEIIFDYACNKPLEEGIRIEEIDPGLLVEETANIKVAEAPIAYPPGSYVAVYVSGAVKQNHPLKLGAWPPVKWAEFVKALCDDFNFRKPIILVGASYDKDAIQETQNLLKKMKFETTSYIDSWAANVLYIIKNSVLFIGYQSGLNILADNMDVPQVMMYFPFLERMQRAWAKKRNLENGIHNPALFTQPIPDILNSLEKLKTHLKR